TGTANAFDTMGLRADALSIGSGSVSAPTVELAPNSGAMVLGSGGTSPANLAQITATTLRVGAITLPGSSTPTPIASAISITSPFNASVTTLDLETTGAVTQTASLVVAGTLAANAGTLTLTNSGNQIGTLGTVTASSDIAIDDATALTVAGAVKSTGGNVYLESSNASGVTVAASGSVQTTGTGKRVGIQADALTLNGSVTTASGGAFEFAPFTAGKTVTLGSATQPSLIGLANVKSELVRIGAVTLPGAGTPTTTAGAIAIGGTFDAAHVTTLELDAATVGGGTGLVSGTAPLINVGTLDGSAAGFSLTGSNGIAAIGSLSATGSILIADSGDLSVSGPVTGSAIDLSASGLIGVTGSIAATSGGVTLAAGTGGITLAAGDVLSGTTIDLSATGGGITQAAGGTILASSLLQSASGVTGDVTLAGFANSIPTLGAFTVNGGSFSLTDGSALAVAGQVNATNGNIFLSSRSITIDTTGALLASAGTVGLLTDGLSLAGAGSIAPVGFEFAPLTAGEAMRLGATGGAGTVSLLSFNGITISGVARFGRVAQAGSTTAGAINIGGFFDTTNAATLDLETTGSITEIGGFLNANTLIGSAGSSVALSVLANNIGTLGNFVASGFTLDNIGSLTVSGTVNGGSSISLFSLGTLNVTGTVMANGTVGLSAAAIAIAGKVTDGGAGQTSLTANSGTISETGTLIAGTLSGTAAGTVDLTGTANAIGTIGSFAVTGGDFLLT